VQGPSRLPKCSPLRRRLHEAVHDAKMASSGPDCRRGRRVAVFGLPAACLIAGLLALNACGQKAPTEDADIVLRVGPRTLTVPRGNLSAPLPKARPDSRAPDEEVVILVGAAPTFSGRSRETELAFKAAGSDALIWVKVIRLGGVAPKDAVENVLDNYVDANQAPIAQSGHGTRHYLVGRTAIGATSVELRDVYVEPDGTFTLCSRREGFIRSPACETWFADPPNMVSMRFGRRWLETRNDIKTTVQSRLLAWSRFDEER